MRKLDKIVIGLLIAFVLFAVAIAVSQEEGLPPGHDGQPESCHNSDWDSLDTPKEHKCTCEKSCDSKPGDSMEDKNCKVYCRPNACRCVPACHT